MINRERLQKVVDYLNRGKLIHSVFDFRVINYNDFNSNQCGTHGCAYGEFPSTDLFGSYFTFSNSGDVKYRATGNMSMYENLSNFLKLTKKEVHLLFVPKEAEGEEYFLKPYYPVYLLDGKATQFDVAANIQKFIKLTDEEIQQARYAIEQISILEQFNTLNLAHI